MSIFFTFSQWSCLDGETKILSEWSWAMEGDRLNEMTQYIWKGRWRGWGCPMPLKCLKKFTDSVDEESGPSNSGHRILLISKDQTFAFKLSGLGTWNRTSLTKITSSPYLSGGWSDQFLFTAFQTNLFLVCRYGTVCKGTYTDYL